MKILDVGAGPMPSATCFKNCEVYCLDPLLDRYLSIGFPLHYYPSARFIHAQSEDIPVTDNFFDAIISVNAIDHINDFAKTAIELKRVLKPQGLFRMQVHYHPATDCEPLELNDTIFTEAYSWCEGLKKLSQSQESFSMTLGGNESLTLWSNFFSSSDRA